MSRPIKRLVFITVGAGIFVTGMFLIRAAGNNRGNSPHIYLKMDEGYGQTVYDSSNNVDATLATSTDISSADPAWKPEEECKVDKCLYFDGVNDYVSIPDFALD